MAWREIWAMLYSMLTNLLASNVRWAALALIGSFAAIALSACVAYEQAGGPFGFVQPRTVIVDRGPALRSDYVYYPRYETYYNRSTRQFVSVEDGRWVTGRAPRGVPANVVFASEPVWIDDYRSPQHHYSTLYSRGSGRVYRDTGYRTHLGYDRGPSRTYYRR